MKILLIGKNGQVGSALEILLRDFDNFVALDRNDLNLKDLDSIRRIIKLIKPNLVINAAAYTAVDLAESEEQIAKVVNGEAPGVIAEELKKIDGFFIHYSTDYVFDGKKIGSWIESDETNPISAYGRTKLLGEELIKKTGIPHYIFRTSWVYGNYGKNFLVTMRKLAESKKGLSVVDDQIGIPTWCYTIANSTVRIIKNIRNLNELKANSGIYNLCPNGNTTWYGFAKKIFEHSSFKKTIQINPISTDKYPTPAKRPKNSVLDNKKFSSVFFSLPQWEEELDKCQNQI